MDKNEKREEKGNREKKNLRGRNIIRTKERFNIISVVKLEYQ